MPVSVSSSNVKIIKPVDSNGNVQVDVARSTGNSVSITGPLDASGNVKVDLETALPAGSNTIGAVTQQQSITEFTSLPYSVPGNGRVTFQLAGTGAVATVSFNDGSTTYNLNAGSALTSGALYEFSVAVASGDSFTVSNATFIRGFFTSGVMT